MRTQVNVVVLLAGWAAGCAGQGWAGSAASVSPMSDVMPMRGDPASLVLASPAVDGDAAAPPRRDAGFPRIPPYDGAFAREPDAGPPDAGPPDAVPDAGFERHEVAVPPTRAGCLTSADCVRGEYCNRLSDDCGLRGVCVFLPDCVDDAVDPACGCDGVYYDTICDAAENGAAVGAIGHCEG